MITLKKLYNEDLRELHVSRLEADSMHADSARLDPACTVSSPSIEDYFFGLFAL